MPSISTGVYTFWPKRWEIAGMWGKAWVCPPGENGSLGLIFYRLTNMGGGAGARRGLASLTPEPSSQAFKQVLLKCSWSVLKQFLTHMELKCLDFFFFTFVYYRNFLKIKWQNLNRGLFHCQKRMPARGECVGIHPACFESFQCSLGELRFTFCSDSWVLPDFCLGRIFMQPRICCVVAEQAFYTGSYF